MDNRLTAQKRHVNGADTPQMFFSGAFLSALKAVGIALAVTLGLLMLFAFVCYQFSDPCKYSAYFAMAATFIGAFCCGFLSAKFLGSKGLISGLICGVGYAAVLLLLSVLLPADENAHTFAGVAILYVLILLASSIGGYIGTHKKKKDPAARAKKMHRRKM